MKVKVIPVLEDNYMYLIIEEHTREAVAVDVAVPKRVRTDKGGHQGTPYLLAGADPNLYIFTAFDVVSLGSPEIIATFGVCGALVLVIDCLMSPLTLAALSPGPAWRTKL